MPHRTAILLIVPVALAFAGIFYLTRQGVDETGRLAWRVERALMRLVPPTGTGEIGEPTWAGLTIRQLAHIAEYAVLGIAAVIACRWWWRRSLTSAFVALGLCALASLLDELHKLHVPGRHFDAHDLVLDAYGYLPAIIIGIAIP